jgi:hypothetical protein
LVDAITRTDRSTAQTERTKDMTTTPTPNYINHIALVLDASGSMAKLEKQVVDVADAQIKHLANRSKELDQETRVTVYRFSYRRTIQCLFYDKDVLRLPSLRGLYKPDGQTALIDATLKALDDLAKTPELYGDHAFLTYVLTDGQENDSQTDPRVLTQRLGSLPDNWTVAVFVPNAEGVHEAKKFGFMKDNIAVWSADARGMMEVGETIKRVTDDYMAGRSKGVRGTKNLFVLQTDRLAPSTVANMTRLGPGQFRMSTITWDIIHGWNRDEKVGIPISTFVEQETHRPYVLGEGYYQLTKPVVVQPQKTIALYERRAHTVYTGADARTLLGLPPHDQVKVSPASHPLYDIFIQSTSVNRKLLPDTKFLLLSK